MKKKKAKIAAMIEQVDAIVAGALSREKEHSGLLERVHPFFVESARNLIHYRALRTHDLRALQRRLGNLGLSRLAKAEAHVLFSLYVTRRVLQAFLEKTQIKVKCTNLTIKKGNKRLDSNAKALLGFRSKGRRTRIMVTLPSAAAEDPGLVEGMLASGMNCARINCAHDAPEVWLHMIENVRTAGKRLKKNCKIAMDLGGPKIRTGAMRCGPEVLKVVPVRDARGTVVDPARLWIGPAPHPTDPSPHLPVSAEDCLRVLQTDFLYLNDLRGKPRVLSVNERMDEGCWVSTEQTVYIESHHQIALGEEPDAEKVSVGPLLSEEEVIMLRPGDTLLLHADPRPGEPAEFSNGRVVSEAHISCTAPEVFEDVREGEPVLFDDGKLEGIIREVHPDALRIEISRAKKGLSKLRADKGINFPDSRLRLKGLTKKDRTDLAFVARYADVVNLSFVNDGEDVRDLLQALDELDARDKLGIILKIETKRAFDNLTDILIAGMETFPIGVMIARGDLAVESGWENIARVQQEILSLCQAAHVPAIWATQVLENLAKKGIPSRAEITDAAMSQQAECVMLNKGPQIRQAIHLLDNILRDMRQYNEKNAPMLPALQKAGEQA